MADQTTKYLLSQVDIQKTNFKGVKAGRSDLKFNQVALKEQSDYFEVSFSPIRVADFDSFQRYQLSKLDATHFN